jgi:hypothetical protein
LADKDGNRRTRFIFTRVPGVGVARVQRDWALPTFANHVTLWDSHDRMEIVPPEVGVTVT